MIVSYQTVRCSAVIVLMLMVNGLFQVQLGSATYVWEDDFEDQNLDDWIITRGVFSAENKTLWAYGTESAVSNRAYHECNVTAGTWNFDILLREHWLWRFHPPAVRFMVNSTDDIEWQGYVLDFYTLYRPTGSILAIYLRVYSNIDRWDYLSHYEFSRAANGWQNVSIQRATNGRIAISLNRTLIIDVTDNSVMNGGYFVFDSEDCVQTIYDPATHTDAFVQVRESPMLDNIIVTSFPEIVDNQSNMILFVISTIIGSIALIVIGKEDLKTHRS